MGLRLKEKTFAFVGKRLEQLESREILRVHRSKVLIASGGPVYKKLREWIRCLYNKVIDRFFMATSQPTNNRWFHSLGLDINQLTLIPDPTVR